MFGRLEWSSFIICFSYIKIKNMLFLSVPNEYLLITELVVIAGRSKQASGDIMFSAEDL